MRTKTHYSHAGATNSACGRGGHTTTDVYRVTCKSCQSKPIYDEDLHAAAEARKAKFLAQTPRTFSEPWHQPYGSVPLVCKGCGGDQFRIGDRTCYGHYDNFHCATCGGVESRATETGMSF